MQTNAVLIHSNERKEKKKKDLSLKVHLEFILDEIFRSFFLSFFFVPFTCRFHFISNVKIVEKDSTKFKKKPILLAL